MQRAPLDKQLNQLLIQLLIQWKFIPWKHFDKPHDEAYWNKLKRVYKKVIFYKLHLCPN